MLHFEMIRLVNEDVVLYPVFKLIIMPASSFDLDL